MDSVRSNQNQKILKNFFIIILGSLIGWDKPIFELGAKPFLLAELFKILILTFLASKLVKFRKSI